MDDGGTFGIQGKVSFFGPGLLYQVVTTRNPFSKKNFESLRDNTVET